MADKTGKIVNLVSRYFGSVLTGSEAIGATVLELENVNDFHDLGGTIAIGETGTVYPYTTRDKVAKTITISTPLTEAYIAGSVVLVHPIAYEKLAQVLPSGSTPADSVLCVVPHALSGYLQADGLRDIDAREDVEYRLGDDGVMSVTNVLKKEPTLDVDTVIPPESITETMVGPNAISTPKLKADVGEFIDVRSETVAAEVVKAGFVLTGEIRVGVAYWNTTAGLVIPQPNGGVITLPVDGLTPAQINAHLIAESITIKNNLMMLGTDNKLAGTLKLSNGVTPPTVAPGLSTEWPNVRPYNNGFGAIYFGAATHLTNSNIIINAVSFFGGGLSAFNKNDGSNPLVDFSAVNWGGTYNPSGPGTQFQPFGGVTSVGGAYFVLGADEARSNGWWIYKLDATFAKIGEVFIGANAAIPNRPAIGNDGTNILVAYGDGSSNIIVRSWNTSLAGLTLRTFTGWTGTSNLAYVGEGSFDFGATRTLIGYESGSVFVATTAGVIQTGNTWNSPSSTFRAVHWDGTNFRGLDLNSVWATYSKYTTSTTVTASYTWYDGDATGSTHETTASPAATYTVSPRAWVRVDVGPPPDNGIASGTDRANRIGIYMATGAGARRRQLYLTNVGAPTWQAVRTYTTDTITTGGTLETSLTNTFIGVVASPGVLQSEAGGFIVNGDGTGAWPAWFGPAIAVLPAGAGDGRFLNGWTNLGAPYAAVTYQKTGGRVYLDGLASGAGATATSVMFVLPVGYRPAGQYILESYNSAGTIYRIDVATTGAVTISLPAGTSYATLGGASFPL